MKVLARKSSPGVRYWTKSGVEVEVAASPEPLKRNDYQPWIHTGTREVFIYLVDASGQRKAEYTKIPPGYELDDRIEKPRGLVRPAGSGRRGPIKDHYLGPWQGWPRVNSALADAILARAQASTLGVTSHMDYFSFKYRNTVWCNLYRRGFLAFPDAVPGEFGDYPRQQANRYPQWRLHLRTIYLLGKQDEFLVGFGEAMNKFIRSVNTGVKS